MEENGTPGLSLGEISTDIFNTPTGAAWDAVRLILGNWIELIFNDAGNGSATLMTHIMGYSNFLALVLISIIISYTIFATITNTAAQGSIGGKQTSMVWMPIRTIVATSLIFPVGMGSATSISYIQVAVAWLGMVGSNAADAVADFTVINLKRSAFSLNNTVNGYQTVMDMTKMAYCAEGFNREYNQYPKPSEFYGQVYSLPFGIEVSNWEIHGAIEVADRVSQGLAGIGPSARSAVSVPISSDLVDQNYSSVGIGHLGKCGNISITAMKGETELAKKIMKVALNTQVKVFNQVVRPMKELEINYTTIKSNVEDAVETSSSSASIEALNTASNNALKLMNEYEVSVGNLLADRLDEGSRHINFTNENGNIMVSINRDSYRENGWAYLGVYTAMQSGSVGQAQGLAKMGVGLTMPTEVDGCRAAANDRNVFARAWSYATSWEGGICEYDEFNNVYRLIDNKVNNFARTDNSNLDRKFASACTGSDNCDASLIEQGFSATLSNALTNSAAQNANAFINVFNDDSPSSFGLTMPANSNDNSFDMGALFFSDPLTQMAVTGRNVLYVSQGITTILRGINAVAQGGQNTGIPGLNFFTATVGGITILVTDYLMAILWVAKAPAATAAYFLPLLPALVWALSFISWLLRYAEAIFNAPLAVMLLATPEGEGMLGNRMERKIALILALVLTPFFLIGGLLLSMIIMSIGFVILNQAFWMVAGHTTGSFDPFAVVFLVGMYFSIMISFMHHCIKIIPSFASDSLEWVLGGMTKAFGNDMDREGANDFSKTEAQSGEFGKSTAGGFGAIAKGLTSKSKEKDKKESE